MTFPRSLWKFLTVLLAIILAMGVVYGGGFKSVYVDYAAPVPYLLTALLIYSVVRLWVTRRKGF